MKKRKINTPVLVAVFAAVSAILIARSNGEPSDCFIWKVQINESTFYMAGSIHAGSQSNYPLPQAYIDCYEKAGCVMFELEEDFKTLEKTILNYAEKDRLPEEQYLNRHLSSESLNQLSRIFSTEKLDQYYQYEGWVLNMAIAGSKSKLIDMDPLLAVDKYFHDLAVRDHKEIIGLDSIQTQLLLFDFEVPFEIQIKIIEKAAMEMEINAENEAPLYNAYYDCDLEAFEREFLKPYDFNNSQRKMMYDRVFTQRNRHWVEEFESLSASNPGIYFVLVGSGHYFGPDNIRSLLEQKGYSVKKI